jgi:hypothetical protein
VPELCDMTYSSDGGEGSFDFNEFVLRLVD